LACSEGDRWHPRYLKQISSLLYALAGVESQKGYAAPEAERLNHALIPRSSAEEEAAARVATMIPAAPAP
jgi:hypothetical protein